VNTYLFVQSNVLLIFLAFLLTVGKIEEVDVVVVVAEEEEQGQELDGKRP
jgi:hypothetical protein